MSDQPASQPYQPQDQHPYPPVGAGQNPYLLPGGLPQGYPPAGYYPPYAPPETNVFAILALILGFFTGILGVVFGHIALHQIKRTGQSGRGLAIAGLIIGYAFVAFFILGTIGLIGLGVSDPTLWEES